MYRVVFFAIINGYEQLIHGDWVGRSEIHGQVHAIVKSKDKRLSKVEEIIDVTSEFYRE